MRLNLEILEINDLKVLSGGRHLRAAAWCHLPSLEETSGGAKVWILGLRSFTTGYKAVDEAGLLHFLDVFRWGSLFTYIKAFPLLVNTFDPELLEISEAWPLLRVDRFTSLRRRVRRLLSRDRDRYVNGLLSLREMFIDHHLLLDVRAIFVVLQIIETYFLLEWTSCVEFTGLSLLMSLDWIWSGKNLLFVGHLHRLNHTLMVSLVEFRIGKSAFTGVGSLIDFWSK